ncbi:hypothetical protein NX801_20410 [Streptomyces sp. LP05-1]|uniref:Mce-associated membrane protein n=1 Tax=Streptomyces pyxinae TaxID=2970734 RepID=A0ABT2CKM9_9ACTN|nr:hypothetical protein [Streptomyces sp. LP05-1]MCS0637974.1 hypothetical protein [Streptomyces sp. LP05-1]
MSTTRHLINRRRRLATVTASRTGPSPLAAPPGADRRVPAGRPARRRRATGTEEPATAETPRRRHLVLPVALGVATVLLGAFASWAATEAAALRDRPAVRNTALTDAARTSEAKGEITKAVNALFSYNYAAPAATDAAIRDRLTGPAVAQHRALLAPVRQQAAAQKLLLTTTVTQSGVELIDGDRARLLIYADQTNTRTAAAKDGTTHGAAMFAVDAVRGDGTWRIAAIDTWGAGA